MHHIEDIIRQLEALRPHFHSDLSLTQALSLFEQAHHYVQKGRQCLANKQHHSALLTLNSDGSPAQTCNGELITQPFTSGVQES